VLTPKSARALKDAIAVTAPEIAQREDAEAMRGTRLYVSRDVLPPVEDEDEFYVVDLIGCVVEDVSGAVLGEVIGVHDFGAGDIVELKQPDGKTLLLGFTLETFPKVDLAARKLVADPPPELEDDSGDEGEE
jgi:16S rRNA processing protein RimM